MTVGDLSRAEVLTNIGRLYQGTHLELEDVSATRIHQVTVTPVEASALIPIELDGETPGTLPATFDVVPGALRVRA